MRMIRRVGSRNGVEVPKLVTVGVLLISLLVVISEFHPVLRVSTWVLFVSLVATTLLALFIAVKTTQVELRARRMLIYFALTWAAFVAFVLPYETPFIVINPFIVLIASIYGLKRELVAVVSLQILSVEAAYILAPEHSLGGFVFITLHALSLIIVAIFGTWYSYNSKKITDHSNQEQAQATIERERLQSLINSMTDGVVATDTSGVVAVYNGSALDIMNMNASLDGKNIRDFLKACDKDGNQIDVMTNAIERQGYLVSREMLLDVGDGEKINLYLSISPVKIGFGKAGEEGYIFLLRDITREKSLEEERDEFISVVSHELRTPITIAEGNISNAMLSAEKEKANKVINDALEASHKQVVFLADMINDLATLSRAERGKLQAEPEEIDVHEMVKGLQRDYRTSAQQKGLNFNTHVDKDVSTIISSRLYLREVLQNFLTNAIKYTQEGDVDLSVKTDGSRLAFSVKDSGIGISKADQKHLFKKFFRSEDYRTRENNGTGLGLYVTLKLAKLINAEVDVKSEIDEGSTFTITVPSVAKKHH